MNQIRIVAAGMLVALIFVGAANAQETATSSTSSTQVVTTTVENVATTSTISSSQVATDLQILETEKLEGVEVETPKEIPSGIGIFWRNVRERVALLLTLDPVKKAEKQLQFAEARIQIAKMIAEQASNNEKVQKKAEKMIEKANEYIKKIEAKKAFFAGKEDEKSEQLMKNVLIHTLNKEIVVERIEKKVGISSERFNKIKEEGASTTKKIIEDLQTRNLKEEAKARLLNVKAIVEQQQQINKRFQEERRELLNKAEMGDPEAREKLKQLNQARQEEVGKIKAER